MSERFYRAPNKRLIARGGNGRFRQTTLRDIGMALCECGAIFTPDCESARDPDTGFIDPVRMREIRKHCSACASAPAPHTEAEQ